MTEIPLLTANDVELRVAQIQQTNYGTYATLLVYKNARTDFGVLNKVFGPLGWQRHHEVIDGNLYCTVQIWDKQHQRWIGRQDVGIPSNTESEKGAASDSFKRACFNFGIGVELYDAPTIRFKLREDEVVAGQNGKLRTYAKFKVGTMVYDRDKRCYTEFTVLDSEGNVRFTLNKSQPSVKSIVKPLNNDIQNAPQVANVSSEVMHCERCGSLIKSNRVVEFSRKRFGGKIYCFNCGRQIAA